MKPPKCRMCDATIRNSNRSFKLVRFKLTAEEIKRKEEMREKKWVGHPPGTAWFCENHYLEANKLKHLTLKEALEKLTPRK